MTALQEVLQKLSPISLNEMDSIKLMERVDTKYVFKIELLRELLQDLADKYRVLEISGNRLTTYESLYFDCKAFDLYYRHHQGKMNRYKVRFRKYVESDLSFFEVKYKNNKDRTIKKRVKQKDISLQLQSDAIDFLHKHTSLSTENLEAKMFVYYKRITLVNNDLTERVTIDLDLNYADLNLRTSKFENLVIVEIKQDKASKSDMAALLKHKHIREGSISKYCLGVATLFDNMRVNNFKERINQFKKLQNDISASA